MKIHLWSGSTLLVLLLFRIIWGIVGSTTARFSDFLRPPATILRYFKALGGPAKPLSAGHNPAGGLMVTALISLLLAQVTTGLFSTDGLKFQGPLSLLVPDELSDQLTQAHGMLFDVLLLLVWMHLVAVFFYWLVKGENLVKPMLTGYKHQDHVPGRLELRFAHWGLALLSLAAAGGVAAWILS
jgi:cytochrome b